MAVLVALLMAMASLGATNALKDYTSEALLDKVDYLPGWGSIDDFDLFSGYITVSEEAGRALFYAFATAKVKPETAPLVLWNNGGPGCSSLGGGFMSELGPFLPLPGGKQLQSNAHAWNRVVNTVFLESPAFVGFSYSNTSSDKVVGDARTAADSRLFMIGFLKRFPHLKNNDLYLSGESYGGHYIPNLALEIVKGNEAGQGDEDEMINLKGFLVGNAWTDATIDNKGTVDFWWYHALISDATLAGIMNTCDFSKIGPLRATAEDEACDQLCSKASREMGPINIYEIFADTCIPSRAMSELETFSSLLEGHPAGLSARAALQQMKTQREWKSQGAASTITSSTSSTTTTTSNADRLTNRKLKASLNNGMAKLMHGNENGGGVAEEEHGYDPCVDNEVEVYLNLPEVQKALHANQTHFIPGQWSDCSGRVTYSRDDLLTSMLPVYEELLKTDLRMLVYSGDVDGIVPVVGTRRWIAKLPLEQTEAWRPWFSETQQVGGYVVGYGRFNFATIRNAGHMVPYVQPERMFYMMEHFVAGESL